MCKNGAKCTRSGSQKRQLVQKCGKLNKVRTSGGVFPGAREGRLDLRRDAGAGGSQEGRESAGPTECEDCLRRLGAERLKLRVPQHRRLSPFRAGFPSSRAAPPPAPGHASAAMARLNAPPGGRDGACKASDVGRPGGAGVAKRIRGGAEPPQSRSSVLRTAQNKEPRSLSTPGLAEERRLPTLPTGV